MKNLKFILIVAFLAGSFSAFSQVGDTIDGYKEGVNQNPSMNEDQWNNNNQNNPNESPTYDNNMDRTSPGLNSPTDNELNLEDSVTLYKKGGTLINTDSTSQYPDRHRL